MKVKPRRIELTALKSSKAVSSMGEIPGYYKMTEAMNDVASWVTHVIRNKANKEICFIHSFIFL